MNMNRYLNLTLVLILFQVQNLSAQENIPHLQKTGEKYQLIVNGEPYLMLAGELGNSTATTLESMKQVWPRLRKLNLNTVLVPIYWELFEPEEGNFDFDLIDGLLAEARKNELKLVLLWFGSWKNSMSSHVPSWVKLDQNRFPRAKSKSGESQEILSPFSFNNLNADLKAYRNLMQHIKLVDSEFQTVILMQPENEIGMLPSARDYHPSANKKFEENVPEKLMSYLESNKFELNPEFRELWKSNGYKTEGNWEQIFGKGLQTEEIFMAYYFGKYIDMIITAGKNEYNIPNFVNAALNRPNKKPGEYPSAGPLPHILDVWKAASPSIDFYSPDFYTPRFKHWNDLYSRQDNPLFIPEHKFDNTVAAKALYAIGHYEALGFSPFSIEQNPDMPFSPKENKIAEVYDAINQIKPLLDKNRGQYRTEGVLLDKEVNEVIFALGNYEFKASHTHNLGWEPNSKSEEWEPAGAIIIQTDDNEYYYVGFGVTFEMKCLLKQNTKVGILKTEKGYFKDGEWVVFQHLNGDQTHQGRHIRSFVDDVSIQRFTLYEYE